MSEALLKDHATPKAEKQEDVKNRNIDLATDRDRYMTIPETIHICSSVMKILYLVGTRFIYFVFI